MTDHLDDRNTSQVSDSGAQTDEQIQAEIMRRINADPFLHDKDIQAVVSQGNVTLSGNLPTAMAGDLLVDLVTAVPGVREINKALLMVGEVVLPPKPQGQFNNKSGRTVDEVIPSGKPLTEEEAQVMSDETVAQMHAAGDQAPVNENPTHIADSDLIAASITPGMAVVDLEGHKVGKVKLVRSTDFHLERGLLSSDFYVPYEACTFDGERVVLKILANEVSKQGWAVPGQRTDDSYSGPLV